MGSEESFPLFLVLPSVAALGGAGCWRRHSLTPPNFNSCKINFTSFVKLAILGSIVKQRDIIKTIKKHAKENGLELTISEGGNHTKIKLGDKMAPIPRHREIGKTITKEIYKQLGIE